jgi:hypothetical protein
VIPSRHQNTDRVFGTHNTWLGQQQPLGGLPALYNLTADPFEKYDMFFNVATATRGDLKTSPGRWSGLDNGWAIGLLQEVLLDFDKSIIKYPNIERKPGSFYRPDSESREPQEPYACCGSGAPAEDRWQRGLIAAEDKAGRDVTRRVFRPKASWAMKCSQRSFAVVSVLFAVLLSSSTGKLNARDADLASLTFAAAQTAKQQCTNTCRARYRDCLSLKQIPPSECRGIYQDCTRNTCNAVQG